MNTKPIKVAVVYNEPNPELYVKPAAADKKELDFIPFFEVDDTTPIEEYELLAALLEKSGFSAYTLNIEDDIVTLLENVKIQKPDIIFNFIEVYKENARYEMNAVGIIELLGIPYTGAPPMVLANCQSKMLAKRLLTTLGITTPRFFFIKAPLKRYDHNLNFPLIVKPAFEDASVGIENESIVINNRQLKDRINHIFLKYNQPVLVEEFINGRELNVAVMGYKKPFALPISEIDFTAMPQHLYNIVSYQAKWDPMHEAYHKTIPICPAELPESIEKEAQQIALTAFKFMGCRDYARVDIRLAPDNRLYVLEVNPNPDLTEGAGFMRSAEAAGYNYQTALKMIINYALQRSNS